MTEITVTQALSYALGTAWKNQSDIHKKWIEISHQVGSILPDSLLGVSVQRLGRFDMLIREVEKTFTPDSMNSSSPDMFANEVLSSFSENWVCNAYEIFRTLNEREFISTGKEFDEIYNDLRLIRIPLEKYQLAKDKILINRDQPLELVSFPTTNMAPAKRYIYSSEKEHKKKRSHVMPTGISRNGSFMWHVLDLEDPSNIEELWIERLSLSNRTIDLFTSE